jgi:flagellar motor switch protein FliN/FliY
VSPQEQIAHLADVPVAIEAELDRRIMTIGEILRLDRGSVVKLTRSAGENIDIVVGGRLVAFGEIVVLEETMGVRITDFNDEH